MKLPAVVDDEDHRCITSIVFGCHYLARAARDRG
jgi:hypothetical protein